ncbi:MAG: glycosyltransferase family 2 protein, partial [bacterium]|nr:glycosyltransferase family 2 protein [bacterium]
MPQQDPPTYALITAVRNEEEHIEKTLNSVVSQTLLPTKWVIVNDGSTDRTEEIVTAFAEKNPLIELVRVGQRRERDFSSKVYAINLGYQHLNDCEYDYLGNLDGDISFDPSYYENILS